MDRAELEERFQAHGIHRVKLGGFDVDGLLRGKYVSLEKFWSSVDSGFGFCDVIFGWDMQDDLYDNAQLTGWHSGYPDALARIDTDTFRVLPSEPGTAHFLIDFWVDPDTPHPACPRNLLKTVTARAQDAGYGARMGFELEYWIFREDGDSLARKHFRDLTPLSRGMTGYSWLRTGQHVELVEDLLDQLGAFDIDIEGMHTETGPGVYESAIRYSDPVRAADMAALFKTVTKVLCSRQGLTVTFMAKWNPKLPGSSGHIHQSLLDSNGDNAFADPKDPQGLSKVGRGYVAGLVELAPELTALVSPTINSYKRYVPGMWAPMTASWAVDNRTCAVRAINTPTPQATRFEYRQPAADLNPYVAGAACLGAGLYGVQQGMTPPPPQAGDATTAEGAPALPTSLAAAVAALEASTRAGDALTPGFIDHYIRTRKWELQKYAAAITDWELARYFELV